MRVVRFVLKLEPNQVLIGRFFCFGCFCFGLELPDGAFSGARRAGGALRFEPVGVRVDS